MAAAVNLFIAAHWLTTCPTSGKAPAKFDDIMDAQRKIIKLLEIHEMHLSDGTGGIAGAMACILRTDKGITQVIYGEL